MSKHKYFFLLFSTLLLCGCGDSSRPKDLPSLFSCTVLVIQDGKPLEEARVEFHTGGEQKYVPVAYTDASGIAAMQTHGFSGAPAGKYKITVSKNIEDNIVYQTDENGEQVVASYNAYKTVEDQHSSVATTPHEVEVGRNTPRVEVNVGNAAKKKI